MDTPADELPDTDGEFYLLVVPGDIGPIERGERFEDPLTAALVAADEAGECTGGGTSMAFIPGQGVEIGTCYIDLALTNVERGVAVIRSFLLETKAPALTTLYAVDPTRVVFYLDEAGQIQVPPPHTLSQKYPWLKGDVIAYRFRPDRLALLQALEDEFALFRVLNWSGTAVPAKAEVLHLLAADQTTQAFRRRYGVGYYDAEGTVGPPQIPVVPQPEQFVLTGIRGRFNRKQLDLGYNLDWTEFNTLLEEVLGLVPIDHQTRLAHELGIHTPHLVVWQAPDAPPSATPYELFAAYSRQDEDKPIILPTLALRRFVSIIKRHYTPKDPLTPHKRHGRPPWVGNFTANEGLMIIPVDEARLEKFRTKVVALCGKLGLMCYDAWEDRTYGE